MGAIRRKESGRLPANAEFAIIIGMLGEQGKLPEETVSQSNQREASVDQTESSRRPRRRRRRASYSADSAGVPQSPGSSVNGQEEASADQKTFPSESLRTLSGNVTQTVESGSIQKSAVSNDSGQEEPSADHEASHQRRSRRRRKATPPVAQDGGTSDATLAPHPEAAPTAPKNVAGDQPTPSQRRRRQGSGLSVPVAVPVDHYSVPTTHRAFAHSSEDDFARILNFYGVQWLYEPRSFPLRWVGDRVVEMFTPDFYLSELDLYVELTTMKQSLVTDKNRKLRQLRELYPDINVKLLYRRDIHRLLAKYGFGPLAESDISGVERVLFTKPQIDRRIAEMGRAISKDYSGEQLVLLGVLRGVFCFMADLMRQISLPLSVDFMSVSYYGSNNSDDMGAHITKGSDIDIKGRHVLLVEDIVDTGMTLSYFLRYLQGQEPASLKVCALLDKTVRRLTDVKLNYVGFEAPDEFLVGYGLDYMEKYRNMPFIGILRPGEQPKPSGGGGRRKRSPK